MTPRGWQVFERHVTKVLGLDATIASGSKFHDPGDAVNRSREHPFPLLLDAKYTERQSYTISAAKLFQWLERAAGTGKRFAMPIRFMHPTHGPEDYIVLTLHDFAELMELVLPKEKGLWCPVHRDWHPGPVCEAIPRDTRNWVVDMSFGLQHLLDSLGQRDLILPYFESSLLADNWPDHYDIRIDSSPYYGRNADGTPDGYFHPSTHALRGERELFYMMHPDYADQLVFERPSLQREMAFAMGSALHGVVQTHMQMCNLVRGPQDIEVEYINKKHHVRGRIDWVTHHPNGSIVPVEFKTRTHFRYNKQLEPEPAWTAQLNLGLDSQDIDLGVLLMVESGYPYRMREFKIKRDRELLDEIYAKFDRVREAIAENKPPRYCCAENSATMHECPAKYVCWLADTPARGGR